MSKQATLLHLFIFLLFTGLSVNTYAGPVCGDNTVDPGEQCDDGNTVDNDGCSGTCQNEVCGDNITQTNEGCDDGNTANNDGCSSTCQIEACGDGIQQSNEACDDGNVTNGDGCNSLCVIEFCGDNTVNNNGTEQCDDGNTTAGDGCDASCQNEPQAPVCGNGSVETGEQCDDGNTIAGDGCSASCQNEPQAPVCGNGSVETGEQCDDGNTTAGDGCSASCQNEPQAPVCGNGAVETGEQCDALNLPTATCDTNCQTISTPTTPSGDTATTPLASGNGDVTIVTTAGETLSNISVADATTGPSGISFPFGTISYTTTVPNPGDSATVRLTFSSDLPKNLSLYKVDTGGVFSILPTSLWKQIDKRNIDITLTDGSQYDLDGQMNASIDDPIAVGSEGNGHDSNLFGCTLGTSTHKDPTLPLLMLISMLYLSRRRALKQVTGN